MCVYSLMIGKVYCGLFTLLNIGALLQQGVFHTLLCDSSVDSACAYIKEVIHVVPNLYDLFSSMDKYSNCCVTNYKKAQ